jgi:hypothetical protein
MPGGRAESEHRLRLPMVDRLIGCGGYEGSRTMVVGVRNNSELCVYTNTVLHYRLV